MRNKSFLKWFYSQVGDPDENIFIVQTGQLNVLATDIEGSSNSGATNLKYVKPGDAIMSLLSFLDHLSGKVCCVYSLLFHRHK